MKKLIAVLAACFVVAPTFAQLTDTFDTIDAGWVTDRYEPNGFTSAFFDGDNRLKLDISTADSVNNRPSGFSSTFYNFQGRKRALGDIGGNWRVSIDMYVSAAMLTSTTRWEGDLWVRDNNPDESQAFYPSMWIGRYDANNFYAGTDLKTYFGAFDSATGALIEVEQTSLTAGWNTMTIAYNGTSFEHYFNGNLFYTSQPGSVSPFNAAGSVFVQGVNFSNSSTNGDSYSLYFDNLQAVPEPMSMTLLALGLGALAKRRAARK